MKPLHTLLKEYIAKSNYTIYQLAMDSGINRTTLQKALSGERPISQENLSKILPFLGLSVPEKRELDQAFLISQIGEITYQKHMHLKDLIEGSIFLLLICQHRIAAQPFFRGCNYNKHVL